MSDGPHGARAELNWSTWGYAQWTNDSICAFPSLTCLAATWNRDLAGEYSHAISEEFAFRGKDVILGPGTNICRVPLNGRSFEYMGEDPYLAGEMAVPYIKRVNVLCAKSTCRRLRNVCNEQVFGPSWGRIRCGTANTCATTIRC